MNIFSGLFATLILIFFGLLFIKSDLNGDPANNNKTPKVQALPSSHLLENNKRIADLFAVAVALERYKTEHRSYPISAEKGLAWSSYFKADGSENIPWISDLAPKYIVHLPRDPRNHSVILEQYAYKSNGANYQLVTFYPDDCAAVKQHQPDLIIPFDQECVGYGFWTSTYY